MTDGLKIEGVALSRGALPVLDHLSICVAPGEFVSLLGPSGAGKSSLFQILIGQLVPEHGTIAFDGRPLDGGQRPFAFMPQRDALMPWRRIIDNVVLGLEVQGVPRGKARRRVAPLFAQFGLAGFERHYPAQLSGGMRQRAALFRTIVQDRPMLLLDEPFGALDALTRTGMQQWLEGQREAHRWTTLLITHDVREAVFLSDRIYILSPRPARLVREVAVPFPRPRARAREAEAFALERDILATLLDPKGDTPCTDSASLPR